LYEVRLAVESLAAELAMILGGRMPEFDIPIMVARTSSGAHSGYGRGLHSFTLQLNFSTFGPPSWLKLDHVVDRAAQVELT
jgi:hypothetical protein